MPLERVWTTSSLSRVGPGGPRRSRPLAALAAGLTPEQRANFNEMGYLAGLPVYDADEIQDHFEGHEGWQYYDKNAILEAMKFAYDKSEADWTYEDYLETIDGFLADMKEYPAGYGC